MTKKKKIRYHNSWYLINKDKNDPRNNKDYKKSLELIDMTHTFMSLIKLREYNKSLIKLSAFLQKDKNCEIIETLSKQDKDFYFNDLATLYFQINKLCEVGLKCEEEDWTVFSNGQIGKKIEEAKGNN